LIKISEGGGVLVASVVDETDKLVGIITPKRLLKSAQVSEFRTSRYPSIEWGELLSSMTSSKAGDIMGPPIGVKPDDFIGDVINLMIDKNLYELPVTDRSGKLLGEIRFSSIIAHYAKHFRESGDTHVDQNQL
jgi:CBS-domain-containing membrane protein